jgi:DNA ligase D
VSGEDVEVIEVAGRPVRITSPAKVIFPERGETKLDLARYYLAVAEPLMAAMGGRPVLLQRFPEGAIGPSFFQKRVAPTKADSWVTTTVVSTPNGTTSNALVAVDLAHVLWAVNMGCLGFHVWPTTAADPEHTDELRIDLDPSPGVTFPMIQEAAAETKALLDELGLVGLPKTTGSRGIHVYLRLQPRWDGYSVRSAAVAVARELERRRPDLITAAWWKEERGSHVFVDFNQNAPHKTVFGAWCARANAHGQVSAPFSWDELENIRPRELTIATVPDRVVRQGDPWAAMSDHRQSIEPLLAMYQRDLASGLMDAPWPPVYPKMPHEPPRVAPSRAKKSASAG